MFKQKKIRIAKPMYNHWLKRTEIYYVCLKQFRRLSTTQEKRAYLEYKDNMIENNLNYRVRRSDKTLPSNWDDIYNQASGHHVKSWKANTRCTKQWQKNL